MSDYYELLGIDPGADKDTIKSAYRDRLEDASQGERAKLNKAWNVLSDPVQRERYDGARAEGWLDDAEDEVEVVDAAPRRGRRWAGGDHGDEVCLARIGEQHLDGLLLGAVAQRGQLRRLVVDSRRQRRAEDRDRAREHGA